MVRKIATPGATPAADWIVPGGACIPPGLRLSFQRFLRPESGVPGQPLPSSLGALPVALDRQGELIVPTADDEAFWIGLDVAPPTHAITLALDVELRSGEVFSAIGDGKANASPVSSITIPSTPRIGGFTQGDAVPHAFARVGGVEIGGGCVRLIFRATSDAVGAEPFEFAVRLVDYATFTAESGQSPPTPLDPNAGYRGWRLP